MRRKVLRDNGFLRPSRWEGFYVKWALAPSWGQHGRYVLARAGRVPRSRSRNFGKLSFNDVSRVQTVNCATRVHSKSWAESIRMEMLREVPRSARWSENAWHDHAAKDGAWQFLPILQPLHLRQRANFRQPQDRDWPAARRDAYARRLAQHPRASCRLGGNTGSTAVCLFSLHNRL